MYCKECGEKYSNETANFCLSCGVKKGNGKNYCDSCGERKKSEAQDVCLNCGKDFKKFFTGMGSEKNKLVSLLLWFFVGGFGGHQFYVGNNGKGVLYIALTLGGFLTCGITSIIAVIFMIVDVINILTDKFKDSNGNAITEWN